MKKSFFVPVATVGISLLIAGCVSNPSQGGFQQGGGVVTRMAYQWRSGI